MVTGEVSDNGRNHTEQEPMKSRHVLLESFATPPSDQVTFPLGKLPVTVAVHRTAWNITAEDDSQVTVVVVLTGATVVVELVPSATTGLASTVNDEARRTRSIAIDEIFFLILKVER